MTTTSKGWAAWALRALTGGGRGRRRPMPRVRLVCEVMEGRLVPSTVWYTGTETWTNPVGGGSVTVTSTVTGDLSPMPGKLLWQYHVVNDDFQPGGSAPDGVYGFLVPVDDPTIVDDITGPSGWAKSAGGTVLPHSGGVTWTGSEMPEVYIAPGSSADFSFTTPDTAPMSTDAGGAAMSLGWADEADGSCAAPVAAAPSIAFTYSLLKSNPRPGNNAGDIMCDFRWDNCVGAASIRIEVKDANGMLVGAASIPVTKASDKLSDINVATNSPNTNVTVELTVLNAASGTIVGPVSKSGKTK